jgi:hypothetical protein
MAVTGPIPLQAGFTSMGELADLMLKKRQIASDEALKKAQATKTNRETSIFNQILGIPQENSQPPDQSMIQKFMGLFDNQKSQDNQASNQPMNPSQQNTSMISALPKDQQLDLAATLMGFKPEHHYQEGQEFTYNPLTGVRQRKIGETPQEKRDAENKQKNNQLLSKENLQSELSGREYGATIANAKKTFTDPEFIKMGKLHRMALSHPLSKDVTQLLSSKESNTAFGNANAAAGDLVARAAKNFKGAFTGRVEGIINSYKPLPGDDADLSYGKITAIEKLHNIGQEFRRLVNKYQKSGMDAFDAIEAAEKELPLESIADIAQQAQKNGMDEFNRTYHKQYTPEEIDAYSKDLLDKGYAPDKIKKAVEKLMSKKGG